MKAYPLRQLVEVRDLRTRLAMDLVREKQAVEAQALARVAAQKSNMDTLLESRRQQQQQQSTGLAQVLDATSLALRDRHIAHLADQAGEAAKALKKAADKQQEAATEVTNALSGYHRLVAKRDALDVCEQRWRGEQRRRLVRGEEVVLDEFVQTGVVRRKT